jgi:hypothetical protein
MKLKYHQPTIIVNRDFEHFSVPSSLKSKEEGERKKEMGTNVNFIDFSYILFVLFSRLFCIFSWLLAALMAAKTFKVSPSLATPRSRLLL